jgi:hypothetical protein
MVTKVILNQIWYSEYTDDVTVWCKKIEKNIAEKIDLFFCLTADHSKPHLSKTKHLKFYLN